MIDLQKEAEEYAKSLYTPFTSLQDEIDWIEDRIDILCVGYTAGANSKFVQSKILQAQIDVLDKCCTIHWMDLKEELEQQLKDLQNENT